MKKLFFTALVAVVAVGGAYAQDYYLIGSNQIAVSCTPGISTCNIKYGSNPTVSTTPYDSSDPNTQPVQALLSTFTWDGN